MTEFEQAVRDQTDEVFELRADLNNQAMTYITSLEEQIERLEKARRLTTQRIEHMKGTDLLAEAYHRVSYEWEKEVDSGRSELARAKALYEEARNDEWAAGQALDRLIHKQQPEGAEPPPTHIVVDKNGNTTPADLYLREWPKWTTRKKED